MNLFGNKTTAQTTSNPKRTMDEVTKEKLRIQRQLKKEQQAKDVKELEELRLKAEEFDKEKRAWERTTKELKDVHLLETKQLKEKISVLEEIGEKSEEVRKRELLVEKRENLVEAEKEATDDFKKELKKLKSEQEETANAKYKTGYADGLADGIRKGTEYSQEDRKMLSQVAMMAAASHTPAAADTIAQGINNALPATAGTENK